MDSVEPDEVEAAEIWLDYRRQVRRPLSGPWRRLPIPCKACGVQDEQPYVVLRERDSSQSCLHLGCQGDRSTREIERLPYPCVICGTTDPGPFELKVVLYRHGQERLYRGALHLQCAMRKANQYEAWARWN